MNWFQLIYILFCCLLVSTSIDADNLCKGHSDVINAELMTTKRIHLRIIESPKVGHPKYRAIFMMANSASLIEVPLGSKVRIINLITEKMNCSKPHSSKSIPCWSDEAWGSYNFNSHKYTFSVHSPPTDGPYKCESIEKRLSWLRL